MKSKILSKTNLFLVKDSKAESRVITCVASSTAVETGEDVKTVAKRISRRRSTKNTAVKLA
jgi:hypothetical protein